MMMSALPSPSAFCRTAGFPHSLHQSKLCLPGRRYCPNYLNLHPSSHHLLPLRVVDDSKETEISPDCVDERSELDELVDGIEFGELCNDFECFSSPAVESTAKQLVRDILELREGNRALGSYAISVKYKDPVRTFTGREKYKRPLWVTDALEKPSVTVQEMAMLSTSVLRIKWTLRGKPKTPAFGSIVGDLILRVNSQFTFNQISGQVIEHEESWDLSASSAIAQAYFWISRRLFSIKEAGKDTTDAAKRMGTRFSTEKENLDIYPDPRGDPTKVKAWAELLNAFCTSGKLELELMYKVQIQCYEDAKLMKLFPEIVRSLYDQDVLAEDTILLWFRKGANPKGRLTFVKALEPFVNWLEEAEEEE